MRRDPHAIGEQQDLSVVERHGRERPAHVAPLIVESCRKTLDQLATHGLVPGPRLLTIGPDEQIDAAGATPQERKGVSRPRRVVLPVAHDEMNPEFGGSRP